MFRPAHSESRPESWKLSHRYDELEIRGSRKDPGYCYQYQIRHDWSFRTIQELLPSRGPILNVAEKGYRVTWNDLRADLAEYV